MKEKCLDVKNMTDDEFFDALGAKFGDDCNTLEKKKGAWYHVPLVTELFLRLDNEPTFQA